MTGVSPLVVRGKSYSEEHDSMEMEIIMRSSHTHSHIKEDNSKLYYYIE